MSMSGAYGGDICHDCEGGLLFSCLISAIVILIFALITNNNVSGNNKVSNLVDD